MATKNYVDLDMPVRGRCRKWERKAVCLSFDGEDDYVEVPDDSSLRFPDQVTFEAWVYIRSLPEYKCIYNKPDHTTGLLSETDSRGFSFSVVIAGTRQKLDRNTATELNKWYHVVGTYVGSTGEQKIYVNGALENSRTGDTGTIDSKVGDNVYIGSRAGGNHFMDGFINEVRIYARALPLDEIQWNYMHRFRPYSTEGLVLWLPMNECVGKWAFDVSGHQNHGELFGPVWRDEVTITDL